MLTHASPLLSTSGVCAKGPQTVGQVIGDQLISQLYSPAGVLLTSENAGKPSSSVKLALTTAVTASLAIEWPGVTPTESYPLYGHLSTKPNVNPFPQAIQTGRMYIGDMTYYDASVGVGSCGTNATNSDHVVALSYVDMQNGPNPNANPLCGREINIQYGGLTRHARIWDTCPTCDSGGLDLPKPLFDAIAPNGDGRVHGVTWSLDVT